MHYIEVYFSQQSEIGVSPECSNLHTWLNLFDIDYRLSQLISRSDNVFKASQAEKSYNEQSVTYKYGSGKSDIHIVLWCVLKEYNFQKYAKSREL